MEQEEAVILVVGGERMRKNKALVAEMLAQARGASRVRTTKGGAQIFSREWALGPVVISTTDLASKCPWEDRSVSNVVRDLAPWISLNSLKQISDKYIFVVCVVECVQSGVWQSTLMDRLELLFGEHRREIMVLVDSVEWKRASADHYRKPTSEFVHNLTKRGFRKKNISFVTFTREDLHPTIKSALETSIVHHGNDGERGKEKMAGVRPFRVRRTTSTSTGVDFYGPWGPTSVILFGRSGSGKSTLAQMLITGRLDSQSKDFAACSGIRGENRELYAWEGRGWYVVNTPGFKKRTNSERRVSSAEAEKKIKRYVQRIQGTYYHFLYVVKKSRLDRYEENLWAFFTLLFGEKVLPHFTMVISGADEDWVKKNLPILQARYKGCQSFVSGEFPSIKTDNAEWETELEEVREHSLHHLEEELHSLMRYPVTCEFGQFSKKSQEAEAVSTNLDVPVARTTSKSTSVTHEDGLGDFIRRKVAAIVKNQIAKTKGRFFRFRMKLTREENSPLCPHRPWEVVRKGRRRFSRWIVSKSILRATTRQVNTVSKCSFSLVSFFNCRHCNTLCWPN